MSTISDNSEHISTFHNYPDMEFNPVPWRRVYLAHQHPDSVNFYCKVIETSQERIDINEELKQRDILWNRVNPSLPQRVIKDYDVWYHMSNPDQKKPAAPGNIGHNQVPKNCKELSRLVGCSLPEKASGHAFRCLCITVLIGKGVNPIDIARHTRQKSVQSQMPYAMMTGDRKRNVSEALLPRAIASKKVQLNPNNSTGGHQNVSTNIQLRLSPDESRSGRLSSSEWEELQRFRVQEKYREELENQKKEVARLKREAEILEENNRLQAMIGLRQSGPYSSLIHGVPNNGFNLYDHPNDRSSIHYNENRDIPMYPRPRFSNPIAPQGGEWVMQGNDNSRNHRPWQQQPDEYWNENPYGRNGWYGEQHGHGGWNENHHGRSGWNRRSW